MFPLARFFFGDFEGRLPIDADLFRFIRDDQRLFVSFIDRDV
jgi:hypothetical protein